MQSFYLIPLVSLLLLGCVSTSQEQEEIVEVESEKAATSSPQNDPCPAPAQPLIKPDAESVGGRVENAGPLFVEQPSSFVEESPLNETQAPEAQEGLKNQPEAGESVAIPEGETPSIPSADEQPYVRSHMNVEDVPPEIPDQRDYFVTAPGLNVRSGPSGESRVVRRLKLGEKVKSLGREGIWVQIGQEEYVSIVYLGDRPAAAQAANQPE